MQHQTRPDDQAKPQLHQGHLNAGKKLIDPKCKSHGDGPSHYSQPLPPAGTPQATALITA